MHKNNSPDATPVPSLSESLLELREVILRVQADCVRMNGILDNIHTAPNTYELQHRLKSLCGRSNYFTKLMRQFVARIQPLQTILDTMGKRNG